jgi:pimeloyl-ACP methyl ester carboxylesterase
VSGAAASWETPETRFVRADGVDLAYQVFGDGPIDIVGSFGWVSHLDVTWELPESARFLERLGAMGRVIWYDKRGTGMSDRVPEPAPLDVMADDVVTVMDAAGSRTAVVVGWLEAGAVALTVAARHPQRVRAVVAGETTAAGRASADHPWGLNPVVVERIAATIESGGWGKAQLLALAAPSVARLPRIQTWWQRLERTAATPSMAANLLRTNLSLDLRAELGDVRVPVLLVHREEVTLIPGEGMQWLADHLPDARLVELPGADIAAYFADPDAVCDEIEEFLHGTRLGASSDLAVRTVAFFDLVDSTGQASAMGDARWCDLLESHRRDLRRLLTRYDGVEVDTAGDGLLASFAVPSLAVRCATAAVIDAERQGIGLRAGVHTAELRARGSALFGVGVHVGARIAALAGSGEVYVTSTVRDLLLGAQLGFASLGEHELRGVPGRWEVLRIVR